MMQFLIGSGALVKASGSAKAHRVLHSAAWHAKNIETIRILLKAGADVNGRDELGNTPLHYAVSRANSGHAGADKMLAFITALLTAGADPNARNERGITALSILEDAKKDAVLTSDEMKNRLNAIANLLRKHGGR
jgi:ankyrin repeat protein